MKSTEVRVLLFIVESSTVVKKFCSNFNNSKYYDQKNFLEWNKMLFDKAFNLTMNLLCSNQTHKCNLVQI